MTPSALASEIQAAYTDHTGCAVPHLTDLVPLAIGQGIESDADLVFVATVAEDHVHCGIVFGSSLLVGAAMRQALERYCTWNSGHPATILEQFKEQAVADLLEGGTMFSIIRGNGDHWRSFRGKYLLRYDELLARIVRDSN